MRKEALFFGKKSKYVYAWKKKKGGGDGALSYTKPIPPHGGHVGGYLSIATTVIQILGLVRTTWACL